MPFLFSGKEYDDVLRELYAYCVKEEVPITAHCQVGGIEAYPDASADFAAPCFWKEVLQEYENLRLNLAHFGWCYQPYVGYRRYESWVRDICDMMIRYETVFADVSHHGVTSSHLQGEFVEDYRRMRQEHTGGIEKIRRRLLYGSDWHVLRRVKNYRSFMYCYQKVLRDAGFYTESGMADFLGGNALEFLGLTPGGRNRERLKKFYGEHRIAPPRWFESIEEGSPP
jgi:predicted TIM-barrel fold metal-dependent hydrolase